MMCNKESDDKILAKRKIILEKVAVSSEVI